MPNWDSKVYDLMRQLECIKCGARHSLIPFACSHSTYAGSTTRGRTTTTYYNVHSVAVPVCHQCNKKFKSWRSIRKLFVALIGIGSLALVGGLTLLFINSFAGSTFIQFQRLGVFLGIILLSIGIPLYILNKKKDANPKNHMKMGSDLVPFIKLSNSSWVKYENWARKIITQQYMLVRDPLLEIGKGTNFCPNCGFNNVLKAKFCTECGFTIK